jgi:hypothetical protein
MHRKVCNEFEDDLVSLQNQLLRYQYWGYKVFAGIVISHSSIQKYKTPRSILRNEVQSHHPAPSF